MQPLKPLAVTYTHLEVYKRQDIAKVISIDVPNSSQCEVVTATMTYRNSAGDVEVLDYKQLSSACANQS
nr:DUF2790 domain-containing protein [Pseudomonas sp. HS-2]